MRTIRLAALLVAVALAAAAYGASSKPERHTAPGLALSVETPHGWKSISAQDLVKSGFIEKLRKESPCSPRPRRLSPSRTARRSC